MTLSSNYNSRPRAAEILVDGKIAKLIRRRETIRDQLAPEAPLTPTRRTCVIPEPSVGMMSFQ